MKVVQAIRFKSRINKLVFVRHALWIKNKKKLTVNLFLFSVTFRLNSVLHKNCTIFYNINNNNNNNNNINNNNFIECSDNTEIIFVNYY